MGSGVALGGELHGRNVWGQQSWQEKAAGRSRWVRRLTEPWRSSVPKLYFIFMFRTTEARRCHPRKSNQTHSHVGSHQMMIIIANKRKLSHYHFWLSTNTTAFRNEVVVFGSKGTVNLGFSFGMAATFFRRRRKEGLNLAIRTVVPCRLHCFGQLLLLLHTNTWLRRRRKSYRKDGSAPWTYWRFLPVLVGSNNIPVWGLMNCWSNLIFWGEFDEPETVTLHNQNSEPDFN